MPSLTEWKTFLKDNRVPRSKVDSILIALGSDGAINAAQIEICAYFLYWWEADPNSFRRYIDANGFIHWRDAHPEYTSGCPA